MGCRVSAGVRNPAGYAIGVDVGGTFTDVVVCAPDGAVTVAKAATTPEDQSVGVLKGLDLAAAQLGLSLHALLADAGRVVHGATVATNALLEGKGARVGMLTTAGHRDVIEMREGLKPDRYNLRMPPPVPMVPRTLRLPVIERIRADGTAETPLDEASLHAALDALAAAEVQAVAVCFLHAWRNPDHERRAAEAARQRLPGAYVTVSSDVLPEIKEYERFCTTVANAMVGPVVQFYLTRLAQRLQEAGLPRPPLIILSHGGVATVEEAGRLAAGTALSGPAGGVAAAMALSRQGAGADLVTFDMGGTSTDIALVRDGAASLSSARGVGEVRIALPSLDIVTLGAGGGSIAEIGASGLLRVGPNSAGAVPGPACYGRGGTAPTVTDASLVLGYLDGALGGALRLDPDAARAALAGLGARLGLGMEQAAAGVHRLVNARMADGVRVVTVRRGVDPRRFTLLSFGGAAGLHVSAVAAELGIRRVLVPLQASVLSAWGMLNTDLTVHLACSFAQANGLDPAALDAAFEAMERDGRARLSWFGGPVHAARSADLRYGEQVFEITVPLDGLDLQQADARTAIEARFHARHEALFTYSLPDQEVVLSNARVAVTGRLPPLPAPHSCSGTAARVGSRRVWLDGWQDVPVWDFAAVAPGQALTGPALVQSMTTAVLLRPGDCAQSDARGWLELGVAKTSREAAPEAIIPKATMPKTTMKEQR